MCRRDVTCCAFVMWLQTGHMYGCKDEEGQLTLTSLTNPSKKIVEVSGGLYSTCYELVHSLIHKVP
jgi:hypothetical protein